MSYQITYTTTYKQAGYPTPEEFLATLDSTVLSAFPEAAGKTPLEFYNEWVSSVNQIHATAAGFVSETVTFSPDTLVQTKIQIWTNLESFLAAYSTNVVPTNVLTNFPTSLNGITEPIVYLRKLYGNSYLSKHERTIS